MKKEYIIFTQKSLRPPRFVHDNFGGAFKECDRLAKEVGQSYVVLEVVARVNKDGSAEVQTNGKHELTAPQSTEILPQAPAKKPIKKKESK